MQQIGLKLWSVNQNYLDEARRLFLDGVYDYIELYVVPESKSILTLWQELKIPFIIHAPHFGHKLNLSDKTKLEFNRKLIAESQFFADKLDARYIILHPGVEGAVEETARQLQQIRDSRILIENKPYLALDSRICVGSTPQEIRYIMTKCGVGFCLDIGHAICSANSHNVGHLSYLNEFIALAPKMYHLSDGDLNSELDSHQNLGQGNYDLKKIFSFLPDNLTISIETQKNSDSNLKDFEKDMEYFRRWI